MKSAFIVGTMFLLDLFLAILMPSSSLSSEDELSELSDPSLLSDEESETLSF